MLLPNGGKKSPPVLPGIGGAVTGRQILQGPVAIGSLRRINALSQGELRRQESAVHLLHQPVLSGLRRLLVGPEAAPQGHGPTRLQGVADVVPAHIVLHRQVRPVPAVLPLDGERRSEDPGGLAGIIVNEIGIAGQRRVIDIVLQLHGESRRSRAKILRRRRLLRSVRLRRRGPASAAARQQQQAQQRAEESFHIDPSSPF